MIMFHTIASPTVGYGHLRRCLTLADELALRDFESVFLENDIMHYIHQHRPEALIIDRYDLDSAWLAAVSVEMQSVHGVVMNLPDSLGDPLLRPQFRDLPARRAVGAVKNVLVTFGGGDWADFTMSLMPMLFKALPEAHIHAVYGPFCPSNAWMRHPRLFIHNSPDDMASLMRAADLAISGGGQTLHELAACGTPTIALCLVPNQRANIDYFVKHGAVVEQVAPFSSLVEIAEALAHDPVKRLQMSRAGSALVDGLGAVRVADKLVEEIRAHR